MLCVCWILKLFQFSLLGLITVLSSSFADCVTKENKKLHRLHKQDPVWAGKIGKDNRWKSQQNRWIHILCICLLMMLGHFRIISYGEEFAAEALTYEKIQKASRWSQTCWFNARKYIAPDSLKATKSVFLLICSSQFGRDKSDCIWNQGVWKYEKEWVIQWVFVCVAPLICLGRFIWEKMSLLQMC